VWASGLVWTGAENLAPPPGLDPRTIQPVSSRYTDYATQPTNVQFNYCNTRINFYLRAGVLYQALEIIFHCQLRFLQRFSQFFHYSPLNRTSTQYAQHQLRESVFAYYCARWSCRQLAASVNTVNDCFITINSSSAITATWPSNASQQE
jgi:hypothetical protein